MRFLVDRCAGRRLAEWLSNDGHDTLDAQALGPDPGDRALLELATSENRILITLDMDFGELIYRHGVAHAGLIRLPDVRVAQRIRIVAEIINRYSSELSAGAVVTVQGQRVRISHPPTD